MKHCKSLFSKKFITIFFGFVICSVPQAQATNDTIAASHYFSKADVLLSTWKLDSAIVYFRKALPFYKKENIQKRLADCYDKIAEAHRKNYDLNDALVNAEKAKEIRLKIFDSTHTEVALSYNSMGHILKEQDKFEDAMEYYQKALEIQLSNFADNDYRVADCYHNIGTIHRIMAKYEKALEFYDKALKIRINTFGKTSNKVAISFLSIGHTKLRIGNYKTALVYYQNALTIISKVHGNQSAEVAFCYNYIGKLFIRFDDFDNSIKYQKKALSILNNIFRANHINTLFCYVNMGVAYRRKGEHNKSNDYQNIAFKIVSKKLKSNHSKFVDVYNELGILNFKKGLYNKALEYHQKTFNIKSEIYQKNHPYIGSTLNNLGATYHFKAEYDKALHHYKNAIINYLSSLKENHSAVAQTYNNIANTYKSKNDLNKALEYYFKALKIRIKVKGKNHSHTSITYHDIAGVYLIKKEYSNALQYYKKALDIQERLYGKINYYVSDINNAISKVYSATKKFNIALSYCEKSLKVRLLTDGNHHPRTSISYNLIGDIHFQMKKYSKALSYYNKAVIANTKPDIRISDSNNLDFNTYMDGNVLIQTLQRKGKTLLYIFKESNNIKSLISSIKIYEKADILIEEIRSSLYNRQDKITFAQQTLEIYTGAIKSQFLLYQIDKNQQHLEKAFYYAEKSKSNTLRELLTTSNAMNFAGLPKGVLDLEEQLKGDHSFYTSEIVKERANKIPDTTKIDTYNDKLFYLGRKRDSLLIAIEKEYPKYYQLKHQNQIISIADIQKKLDQKTTLLEFFVSDSISYAFTISKNTIDIKTLSTTGMAKSIEYLKETITAKDTPRFKEVAHQLYNQLIHPLRDQIVGDQLIIIPDGVLWHLNFELLLTQNDSSNHPKELSYLLKKYAVSYANAANLLFTVSKSDQASKKRQECLAFSFSDSTLALDTETMSLASFRDMGDDLPGTRKEIKAISDIMDGQYYFGSQAIEANFKKNANQYSILHLALHGEVDNDHPENSRLLFTKSNDTTEDNSLYSHELFALSLPAELAVLSACNTGSGKIAKGEGIMSLGNAFQYAGAKSLLLSRWEISDQTTPDLMTNFYKNLKKGMSKAMALQQAKLSYLTTANSHKTHPFYWSGFYIIGDTSPISLSSDTTVFWELILVITSILLLLLIWLYRHKLKKILKPQ
ncbi:tetratricopeptide repeat protein [Aquimarina sp. RZ0]|uniref:CHAT domain-containing protein n=1 Tax=Aquimarina sp. RZ0 TaxID=2607730 RepID=UPI0011F30B0B|nr:CHAT domain-containing tetratricopeptide repeat protein [Aquimarina sp. RZ0]KAA1243213.1 CHAT domain-containing protein [Aquimarina sp. RZ0]